MSRTVPKGVVGTSVLNVDGPAIVTGRATYTVDLDLPRMVHGKIVGSTHPHARLVSVDVSAALAVEGVLLALTPDDVAGLPKVSTGLIFDMPLLAVDKVCYVGEPIVCVVAASVEIARDAAALVEIKYEPLDHVLDPEVAMSPDAPLLHENIAEGGGNVCWRMNTKVGDIDEAFEQVDLVLRERFITRKAHAMPMETHGAVANVDPVDGSVTLWAGTQQAHTLRAHIARVFDMPLSEVRVIKPFMGGAFGHNEGLRTNEAMEITEALIGYNRSREDTKAMRGIRLSNMIEWGGGCR